MRAYLWMMGVWINASVDGVTPPSTGGGDYYIIKNRRRHRR